MRVINVQRKSRRGGLKEAAEYVGISPSELRRGCIAGIYPYMRLGGENGRYWFDFDLLNTAIEQRMMDSIVNTDTEYGKIRRIEV